VKQQVFLLIFPDESDMIEVDVIEIDVLFEDLLIDTEQFSDCP